MTSGAIRESSRGCGPADARLVTHAGSRKSHGAKRRGEQSCARRRSAWRARRHAKKRDLLHDASARERPLRRSRSKPGAAQSDAVSDSGLHARSRWAESAGLGSSKSPNLATRGESPAPCAGPGYVAGGTEKNGDLRRSSDLVQRERWHASELAWCDNRDSAQSQRAVLREVARGDGISESCGSAQKNFGVIVYSIHVALMCVCVVRGPSRIWFLVRKHFTQFNNSSL